jgi:DNA-binding transcriptional MocR family regulator
MEIEISRQNKTPLFLQIKNQIKAMILNGELMNGYNLPSERELAKELGVHRNTIISSYRELKSDGLITSTKGHYYSVTYEAKPSPADSTSKKPLLIWKNLFNDDQIFANNLFDQMYINSASPASISFASVTAPADAYSKEELRSVFTDLVQSQDIDIFEYSPAQGVYSLRNNIAKLLKERQIKATPNDIHIISETNQAVDYIAKLLIIMGVKVYNKLIRDKIPQIIEQSVFKY